MSAYRLFIYFLCISIFLLACKDDEILPPLSPTGISAVAGEGEITITWSDSQGATSYNIYWSESAGVTTSNGNLITGAESPFTHSGLSFGTTHYYIIVAVNEAGEGTPSSVVSATTLFPPNAFEYDGQTYPFSRGYILGPYDEVQFTALLFTGSLEFTPGGTIPFIGSGNGFQFTGVSSTTESISGNYTLSSTSVANTIQIGILSLDCYPCQEHIDIASIEVFTIEQSGSNYTFDFDITLENGKSVNGFYTGLLITP